MSNAETCWTVILGAADGSAEHREAFARRYRSVVEAYLGARWASAGLRQEIDDAVQDVFVDCLRDGGALARVERGRPGGFRAFLYGVIRNVARRFEERQAKRRELQVPSRFEAPADDESLSRVFDRAWARMLLSQAADLQEARATEVGPEARRRVDLLRLRFDEGLPIREIAARWNTDAKPLHRQYDRARQEFRRALLDVVGFHHPGTPGEVEREAARLAAFFP